MYSLRQRAAFAALICTTSLTGVAGARPGVIHGRTADVWVDTAGFDQEEEWASFGGNYERLGQYLRHGEGPNGLRVFVLVDTPPAGFAQAKLKAHVLASYKSRYGDQTPVVTGGTSPPGFFVEWFETSIAGTKWTCYYETMQGGRWLEVHFSALNAAPKDVARLKSQARGFLRGARLVARQSNVSKGDTESGARQ